jgi:uncharacterized membrane protein YqgA involved in biofilm formation
MEAWEIIILVSSVVNTLFVVLLIILVCVLIGALIKLTNRVDNTVEKFQEFLEKPSKFINFGKFVKQTSEYFKSKYKDNSTK